MRITLIAIAATTGQFADFAPYVPSINDDGAIAFQAALPNGDTGVFLAVDNRIEPLCPGDAGMGRVVSHPDVNEAGQVCFYATDSAGRCRAFLVQNGTIAAIPAPDNAPLAGVGPLGPTINRAGVVAFRADLASGGQGIFAGNADSCRLVAQTGDQFSAFHGLPVINRAGQVAFRADLASGGQGIFLAGGGTVAPVVQTGGKFAELGRFPSLSNDGTIAFNAVLSSGEAGAFTVVGGRVRQLPVPPGAFESFRGALIAPSGGPIFHYATPKNGTLGIYGGPNPATDRILSIGDALWGASVAEFALNPVSVNAHRQLAIRIKLADGRQVIARLDPVA